MPASSNNPQRRGAGCAYWWGAACLLLAGCGAPQAEFRPYLAAVVEVREKKGADLDWARKQSVTNIMAALFGSPDAPLVPAEAKGLLDVKRLEMAAGPVGRDGQGNPRGLYREHCAHCHGVSGDGQGPTAAFLNPYPRDYRLAQYKFKSTPKGSRPTHGDLKKTLVDGIPGTAMPSFTLLHDDQIEALVEYVKYLSLRGRVEKGLLAIAINDLGEDEKTLLDLKTRDTAQAAFEERLAAIKEIVSLEVGEWTKAEEEAATVAATISPPPENWRKPESVARGNELFHGSVANCVKCHGDTALGDRELTNHDEWTTQWYDATNDAKTRPLGYEIGALPLRNIQPRNLRLGNYRGGRRPLDLYLRIANGIGGTPMPAAALKALDAPAETPALSSHDIWHLVAYLESLPHDALSRGKQAVANQRERN